jgi:drug/metabolite transporter (DMT)-like permease
MSWLLVTISFYLILAVVFLVDKYLLVGLIPDAKVFTFYVGALGILSLVLAPFVGFRVPDFFQIALAVFGGAVYIFALFWFYKSLQLFEASRVVPAVSGLVPLFTFGMVYVFSLGKEVPSLPKIAAFVLLILGTFLIIAEEQKFLNLKSLELSAICAFLLALSFVLFKYVYLAQPFWSGFIWTRIGGFLAALCFLFFGRGVRREIFQRKLRFEGKTTAIFLANQAAGGLANVLQNWAFFLAPLAYLSLINALQGIQYVFLLIFAVTLSLTRPAWAEKTGLKEEISGKIILQKIVAILFIGAGMALVAF